MVRRVCVVSNVCKSSEIRRSSTVQQQLASLLAVLIHGEEIDAERAKSVFLTCSRTSKGKFLCDLHCIKATSILVSEISGCNKHLRPQDLLDCLLKRGAPRSSEILLMELISILQDYMKLMNENIVLDISEIVRHLKSAVKRYGLTRIIGEADLPTSPNTRMTDETEAPAVGPKRQVYDLHEARIIDLVRPAYWQEGLYDGWDIAVDGAYDSRGHCAYFCKVLAVDLKTQLCIHTEVVNSSETEGVSGRMEREGFRRLLLWFADQGLQIRSVTSDRHAPFKTVIDEMNRALSWNMEWYFDHWHLCRYLVKSLREASKRRSYAPLKTWIKSLKAHLKCAAETGSRPGDRNNIRFFFNTCLYHRAGIHSWDQDELTGPYTSCSHEVMEGDHPDPIPPGSAAHEKLREIVLENRFQNDLRKLGPHGGTSQCETKNALDRLYCPKDVFFPPWTYPSYVALSTLHLNTLRLAEMSGDRVVERGYLYQRKFNDHPIRMVHKTNVDHRWRKEIRDEYLRTRLLVLEQNQTDVETLDVDEGGAGDALEDEKGFGYVEGYSDEDIGDVDDENLDLPSEDF